MEDRDTLRANFDRGFQAADRASDLADSMDAFHQKALDLLRSEKTLLVGGGIRRGSVHGSTDARGMNPASAACSPDDLAATLFHCLDIELTYELMTTTGRPIRLFREGKLLKGVMA